MIVKSTFLVVLILSSRFVTRADTIVTLKAVVASRDDHRSDFIVEIRNDSNRAINIAKDWQNHVLIVDGKPHEIIWTAWWCMDSPIVGAGASYSRPMHLNSYSDLSLVSGTHEIQMQLGSVVSNKLEIEANQSEEERFEAAFVKAYQQRDLAQLKKLVYWDGASAEGRRTVESQLERSLASPESPSVRIWGERTSGSGAAMNLKPVMSLHVGAAPKPISLIVGSKDGILYIACPIPTTKVFRKL